MNLSRDLKTLVLLDGEVEAATEGVGLGLEVLAAGLDEVNQVNGNGLVIEC